MEHKVPVVTQNCPLTTGWPADLFGDPKTLAHPLVNAHAYVLYVRASEQSSKPAIFAVWYLLPCSNTDRGPRLCGTCDRPATLTGI